MRRTYPHDPGSWNRYVYVRGDPANRNDPTGLDDEQSFCDLFPDYPACQPFGGGVPQMPPRTPPAPPQGENPMNVGLNSLGGAAQAYLHLTDDCATALGAESGAAARSRLYALLADSKSQDLGFSSKVVESPDGISVATSYSYNATRFLNGQIIWNNNNALSDLTNVLLGVKNVTGNSYYINRLADFAHQFGLNQELPGFFKYYYEAIYLLHELSHSYNITIKTHLNDTQLSITNTQKVVDNCFKELR
jgi:hypothetical protein